MTVDIHSESFKLNPYKEKYLYSVNRHTFENESSENIYQKHFNDSLLDEETIYIILGTDSGLLIKYLLTQELSENSRYVFVELPSFIEKIKAEIPDINEHQSIELTTVDKWKEVAELFEISIYIYKNKVKYTKSIAALDSFIPEYHQLNSQAVKELEILFFFTRALVGVSPFMSKQLMNITENRFPSSLLNGLFKEKTCVILGGGPSLDDDIEWIKHNRENLVVIAVSRIAKSLIAHQLTPHIIVSVDPYDVSFDVSKELLTLPKEVLFLHANCVNPPLAAQWHGKSAYIGARFPWADPLDESCNKMAGPTVTNAALQEAIMMGFENILLTGVDLCYSKTGVSHASGSNEAKVGPTLGQPGVWVETYAGNKAETQIAFDNAVSALSGQAKEANELGISVYNLSENAAKVENIDYIPSSALSFDNEQNNTLEIINQAIPSYTQDQSRQDANQLITKLQKRLKDIQEIKLLAEEALSCNEKLFQNKGQESENFKHKIRMDKIEKKFDSKYKKTSAFIKNFGLDKFIKSTQTQHEWSDDKVEETGKVYYQAYIDSCIELITLIKDSCLRIHSRIEELKPTPNIESLFTQWQNDKQHGRAKNWLDTTAIELSELQRQQYDKLLSTYNDILTCEDTAHLTRTKKEASLSGVRRKIIVMYYQRNIDALSVLANSLSHYDKNNEQAKQLHLLATAYLLAARNNPTESLNYFDMLNPNEVQEDELQLIAAIAIKANQLDKAEYALKVLSELADIYMPKYAKLLKLTANYQAAIDQYSQYLEVNPTDLSVWNSLGKLYLDLKADESAIMAFTFVLQQEPTNLIAKKYLEQLDH